MAPGDVEVGNEQLLDGPDGRNGFEHSCCCHVDCGGDGDGGGMRKLLHRKRPADYWTGRPKALQKLMRPLPSDKIFCLLLVCLEMIQRSSVLKSPAAHILHRSDQEHQ